MPYFFAGTGSYSGDHFSVFDAVGTFNALCDGVSCGQLVALADDDYYRTRSFVDVNSCPETCNAVCGK